MLHNYVLVQRDEQPKSAGLIVLPEDQIEQSLYVTVLAAGPGELLPNGKRLRMNAEVGKRYICRQWTGYRLEPRKGFLSPCIIEDKSLEAAIDE
jgi:co-chaperonin GroES (HSP10)